MLGKGILAYMDYRAPALTLEPPSRLTFLNSTGGSASCSVIGNPRPIVYWVTSDGSRVSNIPGLRTILPNGTLFFPPFPSERYRQDIHSAVYRCVASNLVGKVGSRDVSVRAVVQQQYQVQVYDEFVIRGNTAILRCQVPSYVRDYVIVTTWERQDGISIVSNIATGGRYSVLRNGELHIRHTIMSDFKSYRCATKHLLSGEIQMSKTTGRLIITDPQGTHPPRLSDTRVMVHVKQGNPAELTCVAQAFPLPTYRWYKKIKSRLIPIEQRVGLLVASGSLYFQQTNIRDSGIYICIVNNSAGEKRLESTLTVTAPLKAEIQPKRIVVDSDKSVTLTCNVSGYPVEGITWLKDQKPLMTNGGKVRLVSREVLRINAVGREDKGIYQCYARNGEDSAQAATELALGETSPVFLDTFIDRTTQPGPTVSLQCVATGTPLPQITWTLDGYPVPDNDRVRVGDYVSRSGNVVSHVNISSVRVEDGGHYVCTAANEVGDLRHTGRLNVYGPPHIRTMTDISVVAGENMVVQCRVAGYPISHITWEKDGRRLPTNRRQQVFPNGTLLVEDVQRAEDEGSYSCMAQNAEGATAEGGMKIHVKEKPLIFPFTFPPETQKEGMKIRVVCTVASGDPPFTITWLKDNERISMQEDVTITVLGEDFSSLTIENATPKHNGRYTCVVKNEAAVVNYTATLTVHVPARWRIQPSDASVLVGRSVTLDCQAEGYPQPQIRWEKAVGTTARDYRPISTSYHYQIFENGSLTIQDVARDDAGYYLCQATNGIGSELSSVISLSVHESPRFETKFQTQMVKKKEDVTMTCSVTGDPPLTISWTRDKQALIIENDPRFRLSDSKTSSGVQSELTVMSVGRADSALYTCIASNDYGQDDTNIQLIVQEIPDPPRDIQVEMTNSRDVKISWEPPFSGNSLITQYIIHLRENASHAENWLNETVAGTETTTVLSNLHPATVYELYLVAENAIGRSGLGQKVIFQTEEEIPEGPPSMVRAESTSSQSLRISWEPPPKRLQNGKIMGYYVGYKDSNKSDQYQYKTIEVKNDDNSPLVTELKDLKKYSYYTIVVQAFNSKGAGPRSDPIVRMTFEDVPSLPPKQVECLPLSSQSIKVSWSPPPISAIHGQLLGHKVVYRAIDDWLSIDDQEKVVQMPDDETVLKNLEKFTNYSISVLAYTGKGDGIISDQIFCRTIEDIPSPPEDIKAMPMLPDAILVSWLPPVRPNGLLQQYTLYQRVTTGDSQDTKRHVISPFQLYYEALRLNRERRYEFWVTASTLVGESEATRVLSQTTSDTIPARIASFSRHLSIKRKATLNIPCKSVGIPTPEKIWTFRGQPIVERKRARILSNGSLQITDILDEDAGNYTCRVQNVYGADEIGFSLNVRVLPAPAVLNVVGATTTSLQLRWEHNSKYLSTKIKGYVLKFRREFGQVEEVKILARGNSYTLENLQCGTKYFLYLAVLARGGEGEPSETVFGKTEGKPPIAPNKEIFIVQNSTSFTLLLNSWDDGGCPIKSFVIRYKRLHTTEWKVASNNALPHQEKIIIRDLAPGTWYGLRITAHNGAGSTMTEYEAATLTLDGGTVAPLVIQERNDSNVWEDLNIIVPIVAAVVALSVVIGVAVCVCVKKRHGNDDYYDRRGLNPNTAPLMANQITKKNVENLNLRDTSVYQSCGPKSSLTSPPTGQDLSMTGDPNHQYDDDIAPYATFRLPGCDSDTESSQGTVRELQTFGQQYRRPNHDPAAQLLNHSNLETNIYQKVLEYQTYDGVSHHPSSCLEQDPVYKQYRKSRELWTELEEVKGRKSRQDICKRLICLVEPSQYSSEYERTLEDLTYSYQDLDMEEDLLAGHGEMSEAECDWDHAPHFR